MKNEDFWTDSEVPRDFIVNKNGVYYINENNKKIRISLSPIIISSYLREYGTAANWQIIITFRNCDGMTKEMQVPRSRLLERDFIKILVDQGFDVVPGFEKIFMDGYLRGFKPCRRGWLYSRLGYLLSAADSSWKFALPEKVYGDGNQCHFVYSPDNDQTHNVGQDGTFEEWKRLIADKCMDNDYLLFVLSAAFAAPLVSLLGGETGCFHFYGLSSRGKTTMLQVAASVWGNGSPPAVSGGKSYISTWSTTVNAIESLAAERNDLPMIIDEIGQGDTRGFGTLIYNIAGGQSKARMNKHGGLQKRNSWRTLLISSGEISVMDKMLQNNCTPKTGQMIRFLDIPVNDNIIVNTGGQDKGEFVDELKKACSLHYGHAGDLFLENLLHNLNHDSHATLEELRKEYYEPSRQSLKAISPDRPETGRVIDRFALVAAAGKMASLFLDLDVDDERIIEAVKSVFKAWLQENPQLNDVDRAINRIIETITARGDLFADTWTEYLANKLGFRHRINGHEYFLFHAEAFRKIIGDTSIRSVCEELRKQGLLHCNNPGKHQARIIVSGSDRQMSFYAVNSEILDVGDGEKTRLLVRKKPPRHYASSF